jgi:hypothetical protein
MKYIITKEEAEKLPEGLRSEYQQEGESYTLKLEGHEEQLIPKAKRDIEAEHRKNAEKKLEEAQKRESDLLKKLESADGKKEVEAIRKQHEEEIAKIRQAAEEELKVIKGREHQAMIDKVASEFASEKFTVPSAIRGLIKERLTVEEVDGQPVIRVREPDGKPSVKSLSDLQKEFLENPEFKPIIKAQVGSGGGANPGNKGGGSAKRTISKAELDRMSQEERHQAFVKDGAVMAED